MRWFTSVSIGVSATSASLFWAPMAYACPLCFASSGPGVLRAYLVSAFFMIGLAWAVIGGIWLYAARMYSEAAEPGDATMRVETPWIQNAAVDFDCETAAEQLKPSVIRRRMR